MKKTVVIIMVSLVASIAFMGCNNQKSDTTQEVSKEKSTTKQTPAWYGSELADAKCKKETAKNEGNKEEAQKWSEKMDNVKKEFEEAYPGDAAALTEADEKYEYVLKSCSAMKAKAPADEYNYVPNEADSNY